MSFEFNSNIPDDVVQKMQEYFFHTIDWQDVANEVSNYIEADDIIANVSRYVMEDIITDHIDYDKIYDQVNDQLTSSVEDEVRIQINDIDISDMTNEQVEYLLSGYNPDNGCSTGKMFTEAVRKAFLHLLGDKEFTADVADSLSKDMSKSLSEDNKNDESSVEVENSKTEIVPLFNPDLIAINNVVSRIADRYLVSQQENPQFLINLQMEMWQVFINTRSSYISSVKNSKIEPNDD